MCFKKKVRKHFTGPCSSAPDNNNDWENKGSTLPKDLLSQILTGKSRRMFEKVADVIKMASYRLVRFYCLLRQCENNP